ncbi:unnamed protein product [Adineta ricciae]|uniref:Uncharacterized protein n=2 Tax=Adineta ricciae TaxID=249248 RepID=A0A815MCD5_ADIRI|nr:unnamed protein product [Adineta ricciae]
MIWLSSDRSNQTNIQTMYDTYNHYQIPFGAINIDSHWSTNFNTFIFDRKKFPSIRQMFDEFRAKNTHIILWMTSFINIDSPHYSYAQEHGFLFNKTLHWWHGDGRLLNYFNPQAVDWWHSQIKTLVDTVGPIHAFKADGSDPYIIQVNDSSVTWKQYRTAYYNDTFQILRQLIGPEALIMSRPIDHDEEFSPKDVVFMGWVGDEDATYEGLQTALRYMLESGRKNYVGFGSDIGGYRFDNSSGPLGRTKQVFLRWTAVGALSSFMENGGTGEHRPWKFDNETVDVYRSWVNIHYQLIPYLYSQGTIVAIGRNGTLMKPCDDTQAGSSQSYFLGPNIYVVPVTQDPSPGQVQRVWLPKSSTNQWINYFNTSKTYSSETFIEEDTSSLYRIPVYIEQNSLIPMYDMRQSPSLNAYRFVLWGEASVHQQSVTLFTRDGQQWLLNLDYRNRKFIVQFVKQYESMKKEEWIWKFCQYMNEQEFCSQDWMRLYDNASVELDFLI